MKIQSSNAKQFLQHIDNLAKIANIPEDDAKKLYYKLVRLERKAYRIAEKECNIPDYEDRGDMEVIKHKVEKLFNGNLKGFFINHDPRGYALKITEIARNEYAAKGINLYSDWGGYGILAPEF